VIAGALLDTSVLIAGTAELPPSAAISVITLGELRAGVALARGSDERAARQRRLDAIRAAFLPLPVDEGVAARYGDILALARRQRRQAKASDLLIIATALSTNRALVTLDTQQARLAEASGAARDR